MESEIYYRKHARTFNVPGHAHFLTFSCYRRLALLTNETWLVWLGEAVRKACDANDIALWAYVFMPEHVHLLVKPRQIIYDISKFRKSLKQSVSKRVINRLKQEESPLLEQLRVLERPGKWCYRFWQEGPGFDKNIWSMKKVIEKAVYCHRNATQRHLCRSPEQWRWSSFRWLEIGTRENEALGIDEWDDRLRDDPDDTPFASYSRVQWQRFVDGIGRKE